MIICSFCLSYYAYIYCFVFQHNFALNLIEHCISFALVLLSQFVTLYHLFHYHTTDILLQFVILLAVKLSFASVLHNQHKQILTLHQFVTRPDSLQNISDLQKHYSK